MACVEVKASGLLIPFNWSLFKQCQLSFDTEFERQTDKKDTKKVAVLPMRS